jgi:EAL domain-containing protein (putative c-di-GMP-specific phosphodiesterase class I)
LRDAGHKVCLDDFGAGASAFQYLRALDVDVVKIDGIYVRDALKMGKGKSFLKAMAGLCNDLGIVTVAEMIENANAVTFLRACGVAYGQGYLFGRPSEDISVFDPRRRTATSTQRVPLGKRVVGRSKLSASGPRCGEN